LALALPGCSPVSEEELQSLRNETEALESELARLKTEADILNRALDNVYREKDRVLDRLDHLANPQRHEGGGEGGAALPGLEGAGDPGAAQAPASGPTREYKVKRGDTLSQIAKDHDTTTETLLRLNPSLANRPQWMVWENDVLNLPVAARPGQGAPPGAATAPSGGSAGGD
jgi:hypothetical protein